MDISELVASIDSEISRVQQARALLSGDRETRGEFSGRNRHTLSADARERIAAAQRKRWAKVKAKKG